MSCTSIMVHVDLGPTAGARVRLAGSIADRFQARLIGASGSEPAVSPVTDGTFVDDELLADAKAKAGERLAEAEALFRGAAGSRRAVEWRSSLVRATDVLLENARACDLIVVGRRGSGDRQDWHLGTNVGHLLMGAGRPVLIVPPLDEFRGRHALVAWKNSTEARRAVRDALPLLKLADDVCLLSIGPEACHEGVRDVAAWLKLHGITAGVRVVASADASAPDEIMQVLEDSYYDLLVCGAYGHSRVREWVLGGVTRTLLDCTPVPCLMAH